MDARDPVPARLGRPAPATPASPRRGPERLLGTRLVRIASAPGYSRPTQSAKGVPFDPFESVPVPISTASLARDNTRARRPCGRTTRGVDMRGRVRLVFSVSVGGICAAFVASSGSLAPVSAISTTGPSSPRAPHVARPAHHAKVAAPARPTSPSHPAVGGHPALPSPGVVTLPYMTMIGFRATAKSTTPPTLRPFPDTTTTVAPAPPTTPPPTTPAPDPAPPPPTTPPRPTQPAAAAQASGGSNAGVWACIREKESGDDYTANTGNGYYGAYQFSESTWLSVGGTGYPNEAPPAVQDALAQVLQRRSGWGQWSTASLCGV